MNLSGIRTLALPGLLVAAAVLAAAAGWRADRGRAARMTRIETDFAAVLRMEQTRERLLAGRDAYAAAWPGSDLPQWLRDHAGGGFAPQVELREASALGGGWSRRVYEITLENAPLAGLPGWLDRLAAGPPPRRILDLQVMAAPDRPEARCTLLVETLEPDPRGQDDA